MKVPLEGSLDPITTDVDGMMEMVRLWADDCSLCRWLVSFYYSNHVFDFLAVEFDFFYSRMSF